MRESWATVTLWSTLSKIKGVFLQECEIEKYSIIAVGGRLRVHRNHLFNRNVKQRGSCSGVKNLCMDGFLHPGVVGKSWTLEQKLGYSAGGVLKKVT